MNEIKDPLMSDGVGFELKDVERTLIATNWELIVR